MSLKHIFRKYFLLTVGILFAFLLLANFTMNLILRAQNDRPPPMRSPLFFAKLLVEFGPDRIKGLGHLESLNHVDNANESSLPFEFLLIDEDGKTLAGNDTIKPKNWNAIRHPEDPFEFANIKIPFEPRPFIPTFNLLQNSGPNHRHHGPEIPSQSEGPLGGESVPQAPPHPHHGNGPPQGPSAPMPNDQVIRLPGTPPQFLVIHFKPEEARLRPRTQFFALSLVLLICSILLGVGVALAFIFRSLGKKVVLADSVIAELQKGNLKARFPIKKRDEFGAAMIRFNQMADEIELLVERLVNTEKSRMKLLQELAHDLRTPVASLKNLLETLQTREGSLQPQVKTELISLSVKEIDYFERLIEDLLILAQVSEPRYHTKAESTDLVAILIDEAESAAIHSASPLKKTALIKDIQVDSLFTQGDSLLLRRMFRNVTLNAFSFATTYVKVSIKSDTKQATITIEDDGLGFSPEGILNFGVRRMTRVLGTSGQGRLSVGLGSVIAKTVAELHRGTIQVENHYNSRGVVAGARITLSLNLLS